MPFTISHAAAILPFHKWFGMRLPLSALVIGSMAPDFAYFVPGALGPVSHSVQGMFTFCLPMGLLAYFVFQFLLKQPTIALLPKTIQQGMPIAPKQKPVVILWAALAILIGTATHILWDSFTHVRSSLFGSIPTLQVVVMDIGGSPLRFYKVLQHVSTIVGFAMLAIWLYRKWQSVQSPLNESPVLHRYPVPGRWRTKFVLAIVLSAAISAFVNYALGGDAIIERELFNFAIGGMAGFVVAWVLVSIAIRFRYAGETPEKLELR